MKMDAMARASDFIDAMGLCTLITRTIKTSTIETTRQASEEMVIAQSKPTAFAIQHPLRGFRQRVVVRLAAVGSDVHDRAEVLLHRRIARHFANMAGDAPSKLWTVFP